MNQFELMILLALDHPWEIRRQARLKADGPSKFARLRGWLQRSTPAAAGLAAPGSGSYGPGGPDSEDESSRRAA
ncbi:MAG TPA: hypothetical protein VKV26_00660 [Dehalococcoidia bacterium]|nr:hypothetical protein [Dehalococcoidia bacterium]